MEIRKMLNLMESVITEGVHDNIINEFTDGIRKRYPDDEKMLKFCDTIEKRWKDDIRPKVSKFPNTWKHYVASNIKYMMILVIKKSYPDFKFKDNFPVFFKQNPSMNGNGLIGNLEHYLYLDIPEVKNFNPFDHSDPIKSLDEIENNYKENLSDESQVIDMSEDEFAEVLIDFKNGFYWFDLNTPYCTDEADAMGHCGNKPAHEISHTVYSFRKKMKTPQGTHYKPFLTFIYDKDTSLLGEMKGRANEKPAKRYHPYIIELLKLDHIKGFGHGGYEPQNNFSMDDLTDEQADELRKYKGDPDFGKPRIEDFEWIEKVEDGKATFYMSDLFYGFNELNPITAYNSDEMVFEYTDEDPEEYVEYMLDNLLSYPDGREVVYKLLKDIDENRYNEEYRQGGFDASDVLDDSVYSIIKENAYDCLLQVINESYEKQLSKKLSNFFSDFIDLDKYPLYMVLSTDTITMDVSDVRDIVQWSLENGIFDDPNVGDQYGEFEYKLQNKVSKADITPEQYDNSTFINAIESGVFS